MCLLVEGEGRGYAHSDSSPIDFNALPDDLEANEIWIIRDSGVKPIGASAAKGTREQLANQTIEPPGPLETAEDDSRGEFRGASEQAKGRGRGSFNIDGDSGIDAPFADGDDNRSNRQLHEINVVDEGSWCSATGVISAAEVDQQLLQAD